MSTTMTSNAAPAKAFWLSLLLLLPWQAFADTPAGTYETLLTMRVDGEITIDQNGSVLAHKLDTTVEPALRALLDRAIPKWKFHPVEHEGKPAIAKSKMRVTLGAQQVASGYQVSIDNVLFHDGKNAKGSNDAAPEEPGEAAVEMKLARRTAAIQPPKYVVNGMTLVTVRLSPTGTVEDILATQTLFLNAKGTPAQFDQARKQMELNATRAISRWRFDVKVPAGLTPRPEQLTGSIMVNYRMTRGIEEKLEQSGQWRQETRTVQQPVPWIIDTHLAQQVRASDMDDGADMFPNASPVRLRDGVIGKAL